MTAHARWAGGEIKRSEKNMLERLLEEGRPLVAAHRGKSGAAIAENTVRAALHAFKEGADIVEFDALRTLDNKIAVFHEDMDFRLLFPAIPVRFSLMAELKKRKLRSAYGYLLNYGINDLEEYLAALKGKGLLNFDRIWFADARKCLEIVKRLDMFDQILFKGYVRERGNRLLDLFAAYPQAWFMPICKTSANYPIAVAGCEKHGVKMRGVEVLFRSEDDLFAQPEFVKKEREAGRFVWVNSIHLDGRPDMCAEHGDNYAIFDDPDKHWGFLLDRGYRVIQTDWPVELNRWLDTKF